MLILILIDIQYSQETFFTFDSPLYPPPLTAIWKTLKDGLHIHCFGFACQGKTGNYKLSVQFIRY